MLGAGLYVVSTLIFLIARKVAAIWAADLKVKLDGLTCVQFKKYLGMKYLGLNYQLRWFLNTDSFPKCQIMYQNWANIP